MTWKELMKEIYIVKGYHTESIDGLIDIGGINLDLSKDELVELASRLRLAEVDDDATVEWYYTSL